MAANEMADLSNSADPSLLVSGSVSRGLDMPGQNDWFGGPGGRMDMMGGGPGGMMGMNPGAVTPLAAWLPAWLAAAWRAAVVCPAAAAAAAAWRAAWYARRRVRRRIRRPCGGGGGGRGGRGGGGAGRGGPWDVAAWLRSVTGGGTAACSTTATLPPPWITPCGTHTPTRSTARKPPSRRTPRRAPP